MKTIRVTRETSAVSKRNRSVKVRRSRGSYSPSSPNPRLNTITMIENAIKSAKTYPSKNRLRLSLPRQIQYGTFNAVLKYLEDSNKIMYDKDGSIIWIFADKPELKKLAQTSTRLR
jgi:hypothetical protein